MLVSAKQRAKGQGMRIGALISGFMVKRALLTQRAKQTGISDSVLYMSCNMAN